MDTAREVYGQLSRRVNYPVFRSDCETQSLGREGVELLFFVESVATEEVGQIL